MLTVWNTNLGMVADAECMADGHLTESDWMDFFIEGMPSLYGSKQAAIDDIIPSVVRNLEGMADEGEADPTADDLSLHISEDESTIIYRVMDNREPSEQGSDLPHLVVAIALVSSVDVKGS